MTPGPCFRLLVMCLCRSDFSGVQVWDAAVCELLMGQPCTGLFSLPAGEEPDRRTCRDNPHTEESEQRL